MATKILGQNAGDHRDAGVQLCGVLGADEARGVRDVPRFAFYGAMGLSSGNAAGDGDIAEKFYRSFGAPSPVLPLVVSMNREFDLPPRRCYHFWFFGFVAKLPYEREVLPST